MKKKAIVVSLIGGMLISLLATAPVLASDLVGQRPEKTMPATGVEKFVPPIEGVSLKDLLSESLHPKEEKGKKISLATAKKIIELVGVESVIIGQREDGEKSYFIFLKRGDLVIRYDEGAETAFIYRDVFNITLMPKNE